MMRRPAKPTRSQRNVTHQTLLQLLPEEPKARVLPKVPAWSPPIQLAHEREALGCYVSHHPVRVHDHELKRLQVVPLTQLTDLPDGKEVRIVGLITRIKRILTTRQQPMAFVHLEDQDRTMEVIVFPSLYRHVRVA
jgi:DNA polymerase-3 subunit alpha